METIEQLRFCKSNSDFTLVQLLYEHSIIYVKNKIWRALLQVVLVPIGE